MSRLATLRKSDPYRVVLIALGPGLVAATVASLFCGFGAEASNVVLRVLDGMRRPVGSLTAERLRLEGSESGHTLTLVFEQGYATVGDWHSSRPVGADDDPMAVADGRGRVRGTDNLFIGDASLMPTIPTGNIHLTTLMIGQRVGEWLAQEATG